MTPAPRRSGKPRFRLFRPFRLPPVFAALAAVLLLSSCVGGAKAEPDTVSETRSQLISVAGGFICLYREGANPVDLLYVKDTANAAGLQVVFKIAESEIIPEAIRKGWGDVAVGFTRAEAKKLGLRIVPLPPREDELTSDAGSNVLLLRSADGYLDALLNPEKRNAELQMPGF